MAHFAKLDENNVVTQVVVVDNKDTADASGVEKEHIGAAHLEKILGGTWKQTSYNGNMRKNYAGIGFTYEATRDAFIPPKPYSSWLLNDAELHAKMSAQAVESAQDYAWDKIAAQIVDVYNGLVKR